eukprot:SAG11_NODE_2260_length_3610_cov_3.120478_2_plen_145_part_00
MILCPDILHGRMRFIGVSMHFLQKNAARSADPSGDSGRIGDDGGDGGGGGAGGTVATAALALPDSPLGPTTSPQGAAATRPPDGLLSCWRRGRWELEASRLVDLDRHCAAVLHPSSSGAPLLAPPPLHPFAPSSLRATTVFARL